MKQRIITGVVLAAGFITLLVVGSLPFSLLIMALALIGMYEFLRLHGYRTFDPAGWIAFLAIVYLTFPLPHQFIPILTFSDVIWLIMLLLLIVTVISKNKIHIKHVAIVLMGIIYIGFGFHDMMTIRIDYGLMWSTLIFGCTILSDSGAYFTGLVMGRNLLWPSISPKKTIEGALGGIGFSVVFAVLFSWLVLHELGGIEAAVIGAVIAIAGQIGDLIQSAYKRIHGMKDAGTIFPGHGGVLDRCDSWLIVFPLMHLILTIMYN